MKLQSVRTALLIFAYGTSLYIDFTYVVFKCFGLECFNYIALKKASSTVTLIVFSLNLMCMSLMWLTTVLIISAFV
jgi:hypothetical protein